MSFDLRISEGDLSLSAENDLATVENGDKLIQDILKIIQTPIGGNAFFPWYGSPVANTLIGTSLDTGFISSVASSQLRASLDNLKTLQNAQLREFGQNVTPQEQIAAIEGVSVERNAIDPRYFSVYVSIISKARTREQVEIQIDPTL